MLKDKRKAPRKPMRYSAWVTVDDKLHGCVVSDISDTGARLDVEDAKIVPERFVLFLSGRNGKARRYCKTMWRAPQQVGVQFEKRVTPATETTHVTAAEAPALVPASTPEPAETA